MAASSARALTRETLSAALPAIRTAIRNAAFVSIDCEFSAIDDPEAPAPARFLYYDPPPTRYTKSRHLAGKYHLLELGLACFEPCDNGGFRADSFALHLFPVQRPHVDLGIDHPVRFQAAALEFLAKKKMDLNKPLAHGIAPLPQYRADAIAVMHTPYLPQTSFDATHLNQAINEIEAWLPLDPKDHPMLPIPRVRLGVGERAELERMFSTQIEIVGSAADPDNFHVARVRAKRRLSRSNSLSREDLHRARVLQDDGHELAKIIAELRGKTLVGHCMWLDLVFLWAQLIGPLPDGLDEFCRGVLNMFPKVIDTKELAECVLGENVALGTLDTWAVSQQPELVTPLLAPDDGSAHLHDAGYDAFVTGRAYAHLQHRAVGASEHWNRAHVHEYYHRFINLQSPLKYTKARGVFLVQLNRDMHASDLSRALSGMCTSFRYVTLREWFVETQNATSADGDSLRRALGDACVRIDCVE